MGTDLYVQISNYFQNLNFGNSKGSDIMPRITLFLSYDKAISLLAALSNQLQIIHESIVCGNFEDSELIDIYGRLDSIHDDLLYTCLRLHETQNDN